MIQLNSFTLIQVTGEKAQVFLQGQLTCDMRLLSEHGSSSLAAICDPKGRMIANFWVVNFHQDYLLILPRSLSDTLINHLSKYAVFSKVHVTRYSGDLKIYASHHHQANKNIIVVNFKNSNRNIVLTTEIFSTVSDDESVFRTDNIREQFCILYPETSLLFIPQMINLQNWGGVSFEKGCYVGQEIVARTQHLGTLKRHLHYLKLSQSNIPSPGDKLNNTAGDIIGVFVDATLTSPNQIEALVVIQDQAVSGL